MLSGCFDRSPFPNLRSTTITMTTPSRCSSLLLLSLCLALSSGFKESRKGSLPTSSSEDFKEIQGDFAYVVYVAPGGSDAHPGTAEQPLATLAAARDKVRDLLPSMQGDILVAVAPGDYIMEETFVLNPEDLGRNGFRVHYRGLGEPGSARLLGARPVTGWTTKDGRIYTATVGPDADFNTLYEDGIRARKARYPNYEFDRRFPHSAARYLNAVEGTKTVLTWREGDFKGVDLKNPDPKANLVYWPWGYADWNKLTHRIGDMDFKKRTITVPANAKGAAIGRNARYFVEGDRRLLDQPGEFYLDEDTGTLDYWPRLGDPNETEILIPHLDRIVSLEGTAEKPVTDVVIEGFEMSGTDTFPTQQTARGFGWTPEAGGDGVHGILHLLFTENVGIRNNHISHSGLNGIYLERSNKDNLLYGNWIENMGISGICFAYHRERTKFPDQKNTRVRVENTLIHDLGAMAVDSAGINIWGAPDNTVAHCEIFDGARYGISLRGPYTQIRHGSDGEPADTNRPVTEGNLIRHSFFHRLGQDSGDMGAIHMAGISSQDHFPVNTLEQLLISDIAAHPSMNDVKPNGIFFDYPEGVTDQVLRDIDIRNTGVPYRTNNTDIRHTYDNVSWRDGFDANRMDYEQIGLKADFPAAFRAPDEVTGVSVTRAADGSLQLAWTDPDDADLATVWIGIEGLPSVEPVEVPVGARSATMPAPPADSIFHYRIRTVDQHGNRSRGVLVRAGVDPGRVEGLVGRGVDGGIQLSWTPLPTAAGYRITYADPLVPPVSLDAENVSATIKGLENYRSYEVTVQAIDTTGHAWPGTTIKVTSGEGAAVPLDAVAWWTFDEPEIHQGLSIGDQSGNGNTLFVGTDTVTLTEGKFGGAVHFDGKSAFIRALAAEPLAIGTGDYAISVWIRQDSTGNFTERFLDFGGTGARPGICLMANNTDVRLLFSDGKNNYGPFHRGLEMPGKWTHVLVNIDRDGELALYVDGKKLAAEDISQSADKDIPAADEFFLGRYFSSDPKYNWPGSLDQLRIFKRLLTPAEIAALYAEGAERQ